MKSSEKVRILVAEDDASIREILLEILEGEGFTAVGAIDGQDASEKIQLAPFDLLISDFRMPRMNGAELLQWCRTNGFHLPVIFITANRDLFPEEKLSLTDCCAALIQKPLDIDHLLVAIKDSQNRSHRVDCKSF